MSHPRPSVDDWRDDCYEHFEQVLGAIRADPRQQRYWNDLFVQPLYQWLRAHPHAKDSLLVLRESAPGKAEELFLLSAIARSVQLYRLTKRAEKESATESADSKTRAKAKRYAEALLELHDKEGLTLLQLGGPLKTREDLVKENEFWNQLKRLSHQCVDARKPRRDNHTAARVALTTLALAIIQHLKLQPLAILRHAADILELENPPDDSQLNRYIRAAEVRLQAR